jgi:lipopolysaccharide transport system permease protein
MTIHEMKVILSQINVMARANMSARYRKTIAGFIWVVVNPIILFAAQAIVFKYFLKINIDNYFTFMLGGLIPWTFLTSTILMGTPILQNSRELLKAFKINPFVLVCAQVFDNGINFIFTFAILLIPVILIDNTSLIGLIYFPIALLLMVISLGSLVWSLSVLQLFFRDTAFVIGFLLNIMFFLTPIFYSEEFIPEGFRWLLNLNIFYMMIEPFRIAVHNFDFQEMLYSLLKSFLLAASLSFIAIKIWRKRKNDFYVQL